jgi:Golgi phosphoprotein 3
MKKMTADRPLHLYEQILLLSLRSEKGTSTTGFEPIAIAGAVLTEWLGEGRISVDETRRQLVTLKETRRSGDPVLDECLDLFKAAKRTAPLKTWIARLSRIPKLRHKAATQLCVRGILRADEDQVLWLFTRKIYPEINPKPKQAIVDSMRQAIFSETARVDEPLAVLISLAHGTGLLAPIFGRAEIRERKKRISTLLASNAVGKATQQLIATYRAIAVASGAMAASIAASG